MVLSGVWVGIYGTAHHSAPASTADNSLACWDTYLVTEELSEALVLCPGTLHAIQF